MAVKECKQVSAIVVDADTVRIGGSTFVRVRTCRAEQPKHDGIPIADGTPHCSERGMEWGLIPIWPPFCPNCGAKVVD